MGALSSTPDYSHLLVLSEESGRIVEIDRSGTVFSSLTVGTAGQFEGLTMDDQGRLYVVGELAGTNGHSALWVYAPVPEPQAWALLVGGLALLGWATRQRAAH